MTLTRRTLLKAGALTAASTMCVASPLAGLDKRRNVLFIAVDDQNTSLGCYGNKVVKSPNLDALAARGVRFDAAYCQYPFCGPSRSSLLTGLAPDTIKVYDLQAGFRNSVPEAITLPQLFRKNGYFCARVGKIFHAGVPDEIGLNGQDDPASWEYVYNPVGADHINDELLVTNYTPERAGTNLQGQPHLLGSTISFYEAPTSDRTMTDSLGADEIIRLMKAKQHIPFFLAFGLYRPHVPWIVPKPYFDKYPLETIDVRSFNPSELKQAPRAAYWTQPPNFGMDDMQRRQAVRAYYASSSFMDAQVGRVLRELKQLGLEENTVVVFWADHGWNLGEHGQWMKQSLFEPSARVPLVFAGPSVKFGGVCHRTVEHLDIYPTLAEVCQLQNVPTSLQGTSLAPLLHNPESLWDRPSISQVLRTGGSDPASKTAGYSIRSERYRYTSWHGTEEGEELYDYSEDPHELRNRAADPAMQEIRTTMKNKLDEVTVARGRLHES